MADVHADTEIRAVEAAFEEVDKAGAVDRPLPITSRATLRRAAQPDVDFLDTADRRVAVVVMDRGPAA